MKTEMIKSMVLDMESVGEIEDFIWGLMQEFTTEAVKKTCKHFGVETLKGLEVLDSKSTAYDCGWLLWKFNDVELNDRVKKLHFREWGYKDSSMRIETPVNVQGTTIQRYCGEILRDNLSQLCSLSFAIHLD